MEKRLIARNTAEAEKSCVGSITEGASLSLEDKGGHHLKNKRPGNFIAGVMAAITIGVTLMSAPGCSTTETTPKPDSRVRQGEVDRFVETARKLKFSEIRHMRESDVEIQNLRNAGVLKAGQTPLKFGDMWAAPDDVPLWYSMDLENARLGEEKFSQRDIARAKASDYNRLLKTMYDVKDDYRANLDRNNFMLLSESLNPRSNVK